jgi:hypothetical protein
MSKPIKIAFGGTMGSGKDTCVDYLASKFPNYTRLSFAQPIYDILEYAQTKCGFPKHKDRKFLQFIGTDWARNIDDNVWINIVLNTEIKNVGLLSDVRFFNEFQALKDNGWICIKINRHNYDKTERSGSGNILHSSELELQNINDNEWHYIIDNNSTLNELYQKLDNIILQL